MKGLLLASVALLSITFTGCNKRTSGSTNTTGTTYKGVVRVSMCGQIVVETIGPNFLGEDTWTPGSYAGAPTYHHVFTVQNACQFTNREGDAIEFIVVKEEEQKCAQCMAYTPTPDTKYAIRVIK